MRVHAITSWGTACGIAAYAESLLARCRHADASAHTSELVLCRQCLVSLLALSIPAVSVPSDSLTGHGAVSAPAVD